MKLNVIKWHEGAEAANSIACALIAKLLHNPLPLPQQTRVFVYEMVLLVTKRVFTQRLKDVTKRVTDPSEMVPRIIFQQPVCIFLAFSLFLC